MAQDDMLHAFAPDAFDIYALFERYGEMDAVCIFRNKSLGSYYMLLHKYEKAYTTKLSKEQAEVLNFISLNSVKVSGRMNWNYWIFCCTSRIMSGSS
ncbi:MAG: hypothetical protein II145_00130 [Selenomonas sp.]|nr:hypothetical protein [Selenomonas sp.]